MRASMITLSCEKQKFKKEQLGNSCLIHYNISVLVSYLES